MKTPRDIRRILDKLETQHPGADTELHYTTPFELLVATILSAQSTDARVNMVTPALFTRYPAARALANATPAELQPQIHSTGFFRAKATSLLGMAQALVTNHQCDQGAVDDDCGYFRLVIARARDHKAPKTPRDKNRVRARRR